MMTTLIIILALAALVHFIYEGTVAPSIRLSCSYKLFRLRDELRGVKADSTGVGREVFDELHESINITIRLLPILGPDMLLAVRQAMKNDPALAARVKRRQELFRTCTNPEIHRIRREALSVVQKNLIVNTAGLLFWLIPVCAIAIALGKTKRLFENLLFLPKHDFERMVPAAQPVPSYR